MADYHESRDFAPQRECRVKFVNGVWFPVQSKVEDLNNNNCEQTTYSYDRESYDREQSAELEEGSNECNVETIGEEFYEVQEHEITFDDEDVFLPQPEFVKDCPTREFVANGETGQSSGTKMGVLEDENDNTTLLLQPELGPKQEETSMSFKEETIEQNCEKITSREKEVLSTTDSSKYSPLQIVVMATSLNSSEGVENCILDQHGGECRLSKGKDLSMQAPSRPIISSSFPEKAQYIEDGIRWITCELQEMKKIDRNINSNLMSLMTSIKQLKKINETFSEQQEILEDLEDIFEKEQFENSHLIDVPLQSREDGRLGLKRKVSNLERYTRLGRDGRRASYY